MRSIVSSAIVPCTSAIGAGSMSSTASPTRDTCAGGRCSSPLERSREPTNRTSTPRCGRRPTPRCARARAGAAARPSTAPRQQRNLPYGRSAACSICDATVRAGCVRRDRVGGAEQQHVGAVGEHDQRDHLPGLRLSRARRRAAARRARCRCCRPSTSGRRASASFAMPSRAAMPADRAGVHAGDDRPCAPGRPRARPPSAPRSTPGRRAARTWSRRSALPTRASAVEPGVRQRSMNSSVALAPPRYSAMTAPSLLVADEQRAGAVAESPASSPLVGRPVRRSEVTTSTVPLPSSAARSAPIAGAQRAAEVERGHVGVEAQRGVDRRRVVLVEVRGLGGREPQRVGRDAVGRAAQREPGRFDAHRRGVLVVATRPNGCPCRRRCRTSWRSRSVAGAGTARSRRPLMIPRVMRRRSL